MRIIGIRIPGRFQDAYLYKGQVLAVTKEMSIRRYRLEEIVKALKPDHPHSVPLLEYMFLRNDWLNSDQFRLLISNADILKAFLALFEHVKPQIMDFKPEAVELQEESLALDANSYLDMEVYNDRLYIGVDSGLFCSEMNVTNYASHLLNPVVKRHDAPCIDVSVRYALVNTSCGPDGLFAANEYFNNDGMGTAMRFVAEKSLRTDWMDYDIMNYPTQEEPRLIQTTHERRSDAGDLKGQIITSIEETETDLDYLLNALHIKYDVHLDTIQYTYNVLRHLFVQTMDEGFYSLALTKPERGLPETAHIKKYKASPKRIMSVGTCKAGQVIEGEDAVYLFDKDDLHTVVEGGCLSVRTFGRSRRYKNIILITKPKEILLLSVLNEL